MICWVGKAKVLRTEATGSVSFDLDKVPAESGRIKNNSTIRRFQSEIVVRYNVRQRRFPSLSLCFGANFHGRNDGARSDSALAKIACWTGQSVF
jgi:hypothetical protein